MPSLTDYAPNCYFYMYAKDGGTVTVPGLLGGTINIPAYQPIAGPFSIQQIKEFKAYTEKRYEGIYDDPDIKIIKVFAQCSVVSDLETEPTY